MLTPSIIAIYKLLGNYGGSGHIYTYARGWLRVKASANSFLTLQCGTLSKSNWNFTYFFYYCPWSRWHDLACCAISFMVKWASWIDPGQRRLNKEHLQHVPHPHFPNWSDTHTLIGSPFHTAANWHHCDWIG